MSDNQKVIINRAYSMLKSLSLRRLPVNEKSLISMIKIVNQQDHKNTKLTKMNEALSLIQILNETNSKRFWARVSKEQAHKDLMASSLDEKLMKRYELAMKEGNLEKVLSMEKEVRNSLKENDLEPSAIVRLIRLIEEIVTEKKLLSLLHEKTDIAYLAIEKNVNAVIYELNRISKTGDKLSEEDHENTSLMNKYSEILRLRAEINDKLVKSTAYFKIPYQSSISSEAINHSGEDQKKEIDWDSNIKYLEEQVKLLMQKLAAKIACTEDDPQVKAFKDQFLSLIEGLKNEQGVQKQQIFDLIAKQIDQLDCSL